jgi:hypothetical protein
VYTCPYCNEEVLMPRAWVLLRWVWLAAFTGALGMVIVLPLMHHETGVLVRSSEVLSVQSWILFSIASLLFLLPHPTQDVIVCSQRELFTWQLKSLLGSLMIGGSALICATQGVYGLSDWTLAFSSGVGVLCLLASPWFFRLCAWRIWVGTVLLFVLRAV